MWLNRYKTVYMSSLTWSFLHCCGLLPVVWVSICSGLKTISLGFLSSNQSLWKLKSYLFIFHLACFDLCLSPNWKVPLCMKNFVYFFLTFLHFTAPFFCCCCWCHLNPDFSVLLFCQFILTYLFQIKVVKLFSFIYLFNIRLFFNIFFPIYPKVLEQLCCQW